MHKLPNWFYIFRLRAHGSSPWPLVIFESCSASLEARVPFETPYTAHGLSSIHMSYHFKSLCSRFAEFKQNLMFGVCSSFTSMLKSQMWRHTWWQTFVLCNSQCSHSDATRHTEWRCSLLPSTARAFTYCHGFVFCGTSLETFWYTFVIYIALRHMVT